LAQPAMLPRDRATSRSSDLAIVMVRPISPVMVDGEGQF
jgi:hypothetical protein